MGNNKTSFYSVMAGLERTILPSDSYPRFCKKVLESLIEYVEAGRNTSSRHRQFVGRNFRLSTEKLCKKWNEENPFHQKAEKTFYSQVSSFSNELYSLFGDDTKDVFLNCNKELGIEIITRQKIQEIAEKVTVLNMDDSFSQGIFVSEVANAVSGVKPNFLYAAVDCLPEIEAMKSLTKFHAVTAMKQLDLEKVAYIKSELEQPLLYKTKEGTLKFNNKKLELLRAFDMLPKDMSYVPMKIMLTDRLQKLLLEMFDSSRLNDCDEPDPAAMTLLKQIIRLYFTEEGCRDLFSNFSAIEVKEAFREVMKGR